MTTSTSRSNDQDLASLEAGVAWSRRLAAFAAPSPRFKCVLDETGDAVVTSQPLPFLRALATNDPASHLLMDCLECFERRYGTGTGLLCLLTSCIGQKMLAMIREGYPCYHVVGGFEEAASVCSQTCRALSIPLEDLSRIIRSFKGGTTQQHDEEALGADDDGSKAFDPPPLHLASGGLHNANEEDEFSWFFDGPVAGSTTPVTSAAAPSVSKSKGGGTCRHSNGSPVIRLGEVASWLQAHLPADYPTTPDDVTHPVFATLPPSALPPPTEVKADSLSLPMRLAMTAWSLSTSTPSPASSPIIQKVIGPSPRSSQVIPHSVLIPIHPHHRSHVGCLLARKVEGSGCGERARFQHVVCLLDNFCFPGGVSEAAESCKPTAFLTSRTDQSPGLRLLDEPDRPSAVVSLLRRYHVDLLCVQGSLEEDIRQACANAGILVLTDLRKAEAEAVSRLSGSQVVEDLHGLSHAHVGSTPVWGVMVEAGWSGPCDDRFLGIARATLGVCLPEMSLLLMGDSLSGGIGEVPPTILLTAPTPFLATALEEQVLLCLAQLSDCMVGGKAVMGLGLVEVVSVLQLERMADDAEEEEEETLTRETLRVEAVPCGHLYRPAILRGFAGGLRDFLLERLVDGGDVSIDGAVAALNRTAMGVRRLLEEHEEGGGGGNMLRGDRLPPGLISAMMDECASMGLGRELVPWALIESPRAKEALFGEVVRLVSRLARLTPSSSS